MIKPDCLITLGICSSNSVLNKVIYYPEDESNIFLRIIGKYIFNYTASHDSSLRNRQTNYL
jgi:hypothetical protein